MLELPAFTSYRSLMMYTATKSFEKFWQPKSVKDEKKNVDNAVPKSTAYKQNGRVRFSRNGNRID